jgi:F0F1-type ATP synthase membrane subunit b/b'
LEIIPDPVHAALMTLPFAVAAMSVYLILWRPLLAYMDQREQVSEHARHEAHKLEEDAAQQLARIDSHLASARNAVAEQRAAARGRAAVKEAEILAAARTAADGRLENALSELRQARSAASSALESSATELSTTIAGRVLGRPLA